MAQEIKIMVRPDIGGRQSVVEVEQEFARLSSTGGWKLKDVFHIGMEKSGSHNVMFVLVRETELVVDEVAKRGRPPKVE
jgi:uncharacterized protein YjlB